MAHIYSWTVWSEEWPYELVILKSKMLSAISRVIYMLCPDSLESVPPRLRDAIEHKFTKILFCSRKILSVVTYQSTASNFLVFLSPCPRNLGPRDSKGDAIYCCPEQMSKFGEEFGIKDKVLQVIVFCVHLSEICKQFAAVIMKDTPDTN